MRFFGGILKKIICGFVAAALISGCVPVTSGGVGEMRNGQPISGLISVDNMAGMNTVTIASPGEWECVSNFGRSNAPGTMVRTVPLTCNNGAKGTLIITGNQFQQQIVGTFKLTNGESGRVVFGYV